jgi:hypothetical protein
MTGTGPGLGSWRPPFPLLLFLLTEFSEVHEERSELAIRNVSRNAWKTVVRYSGVVTEGTKEQDSGTGRMSARVAAWLAWSLASLSVAMFAATGVLDALARTARSSVEWLTVGSVSDAVISSLFLAFPIVGALIASRRPQNPIGWILLADGLLWMVLAVTDSYSVYGAARPGSVPFPVAIGTIGNQWLWVPTVGLLGIYLILLFPDGKLPSKRWRPLAWFSGVMVVLLSITEGLAPGPLENQGGIRNPFWARGAPLVGDCVIYHPPAAAFVHPRVGGEHGVAFPAFEGRGAPTDQVVHLRRLIRWSLVLYGHNRCGGHRAGERR